MTQTIGRRLVVGLIPRRIAAQREDILDAGADESLEELVGLEPEDDEEKADFLPAAETLGEIDAE